MEIRRLSIEGYKILRKLSSGKLSYQEVKKLDQRPLRGLFIQGAFVFDSHMNAEVTNEGWELMKETTRTPRHRQNFKAPLFKASGERIIRRVKLQKTGS